MSTPDVLGVPLPEPTALTAPWWSACTEQRLLVQECSACGLRWFTPEEICVGCRSAAWNWAESPGTGKVYSLTVVHRSPRPEFTAPYVIAVVELDDGWSILANLDGSDPQAWRNDDRVQVAFRSSGERCYPVFVAQEAA